MDRQSADRERPESTDLDALLAAREGDDDAGQRIVSRFGESMMKTAWRVLGSHRDDAADVVQEALFAALTTSSVPAGNVGAWLRAITVRKALDSIRRRDRTLETDSVETMTDSALTWEGSSAETHIDARSARRAIEQLRPLDRAVLTLVDLEEMSTEEAARALGLSRDAVKTRASRARRKLIEKFRGEAPKSHRTTKKPE